jgi:hypothetical protein
MAVTVVIDAKLPIFADLPSSCCNTNSLPHVVINMDGWVDSFQDVPFGVPLWL